MTDDDDDEVVCKFGKIVLKINITVARKIYHFLRCAAKILEFSHCAVSQNSMGTTDLHDIQTKISNNSVKFIK